MKNNKRKFLVLSIVAALTLSSMAGCGNGEKNAEDSSGSSSGKVDGTTFSDEDDETTFSDEDLMKQPVTFHFNSDEEEEDPASAALNGEDPTAPEGGDDSSETATKYIAVTEADGTPVTTYVNVTDANGETVTDSKGQTVTEAVQVTTAVSVDSDDNGGGNSSYTANMDEAWAMWLDISKDADYIFNDAFIEVTFKIKENAPDGAYDVVISDPDFACMLNGGTTLVPDTVLDGKVYVSEDLVPQRELTDEDGFTVYTDNVAAKQGDEVTLCFRLKDNPGMVAMMFKFQYDKNAMSIVDCSAVGEFYEIARPSFKDIEEETTSAQ